MRHMASLQKDFLPTTWQASPSSTVLEHYPPYLAQRFEFFKKPHVAFNIDPPIAALLYYTALSQDFAAVFIAL